MQFRLLQNILAITTTALNLVCQVESAVNVNKTESILFSRFSQESRDKYKIAFNNIDLPWSKHYKYLEVILDQDLTFKQHIHTTRIHRVFDRSS